MTLCRLCEMHEAPSLNSGCELCAACYLGPLGEDGERWACLGIDEAVEKIAGAYLRGCADEAEEALTREIEK